MVLFALLLAVDVIARAGSTEVTVDELRSYLATLPATERRALAREPAALSQAVRAYLARRALLQEAAAKKLEELPEVKAKLQRVREDALVDLYLDSISVPPEGYPSEADVQAAYEKNGASFDVPRQYRLAQVFVAQGKDAEQAARRPHPASEFVDLGWLSEAQLVPGIRATVVGLPAGSVSDPVRLEDGWHLVKLLETRPATHRTLAEVRGTIVAGLRAEKTQALRRAHLARLLDRSPPAVNELVLGQVLQ